MNCLIPVSYYLCFVIKIKRQTRTIKLTQYQYLMISLIIIYSWISNQIQFTNEHSTKKKNLPRFKFFVIYARYKYYLGWYLKKIAVLINNIVCTTVQLYKLRIITLFIT